MSGVVVEEASGMPLADAIVEAVLADSEQSARRQLTDTKGRFVFADLPSGTVTIRARKPGFVDPAASARAPASSTLVAVGDGEWVSNVRVRLWRTGVIGGTVLDERGNPVVDVWVRVLVKTRLFGYEWLVARSLTRTDDRGRYRAWDLPPGDYLVQVPSRQVFVPQLVQLPRSTAPRPIIPSHFPIPPPAQNGVAFAYPAAFSPSVRTPELASVVALRAGEERDDIHVTLTPLPAFRISGTLVGPPEAWRRLTLRLVADRLEELGPAGVMATASVGDDGAFAFPNVPAGVYTIDGSRIVSTLTLTHEAADVGELQLGRFVDGAETGTIVQSLEAGPLGLRYAVTTLGSEAADYWIRQSIVVGKDDANVHAVMQPSGIMRGIIRKELSSRARVPDIEPDAAIELLPVDTFSGVGAPRSDSTPHQASGEFTIRGLMPARYVLRARYGWIVKAVTWNGRDYSDSPFDATENREFNDVEIVVTNVGATLFGTARSDPDTPAIESAVVLFPAASTLWTNPGPWPRRIRSTVVANDGRYELANVPAGDYYVIALSGRPEVDPDFFRLAQPRAIRVSLSWAQTTTQDLTVHPEVR